MQWQSMYSYRSNKMSCCLAKNTTNLEAVRSSNWHVTGGHVSRLSWEKRELLESQRRSGKVALCCGKYKQGTSRSRILRHSGKWHCAVTRNIIKESPERGILGCTPFRRKGNFWKVMGVACSNLHATGGKKPWPHLRRFLKKKRELTEKVAAFWKVASQCDKKVKGFQKRCICCSAFRRSKGNFRKVVGVAVLRKVASWCVKK